MTLSSSGLSNLFFLEMVKTVSGIIITLKYNTREETYEAVYKTSARIEYLDITHEEFKVKMKWFTDNLNNLFDESHNLEVHIKEQLSRLKYE